MAKDKNYKTESGKEYIIKGGVYTGFSGYDKQGNKVTEGAHDHPVDVMNAIDKQEAKESINQTNSK